MNTGSDKKGKHICLKSKNLEYWTRILAFDHTGEKIAEVKLGG
jgi:hypothetical protein